MRYYRVYLRFMKKIKTVIVASPGNSGAGAIHDYLLSRQDFLSPFFSQEFRFINDPQGLYSLYHNLYKNFNVNNAAFFFDEFKNYSHNLTKLNSSQLDDSGALIKSRPRKIYTKSFLNNVEKFLENVTEVKYNALPQFKKIDLNIYEKFKYFVKLKVFKKSINDLNLFEMRIPKDEKFFVKEAKDLIKKIFNENINKKNKNIILNQCVNFWKPSSSSIFFDNAKIILVTRDPRSVFASMRSRNSFAFPGKDVKIFVKWYKTIMTNFSFEINNKDILKIKFENFVINFKSEKSKVCRFLNIKNNVITDFNIDYSKKNIYKALKILDKKDLKYIEQTLSNFLQWKI